MLGLGPAQNDVTEENSKVARFAVDEGFENVLNPHMVLAYVWHTEEFQKGVEITESVLQWGAR